MLTAAITRKQNDVAFWDNRVCVCTPKPARLLANLLSQNHSASYGFAPHRRHAVRVATQAERPHFDPAGKSQEEELNARYGLPTVNKDGSGDTNYND